jgi:predicted O-methyltransferase YrrM
MKPKVILEIGTASGGTLFLFSHVASDGATVISIDLPGGRFGGGYPAWRTLLYESFALPGQQLHLLRADSHKRDTLEQVKLILGGREIDFLFVDGDHRYEGVKRDFEMYSPLVSEGGIIAFHDIVPGGRESVGGVPQFWNEVKSYYRDREREIVQDESQGGFGIGLLYVTMAR